MVGSCCGRHILLPVPNHINGHRLLDIIIHSGCRASSPDVSLQGLEPSTSAAALWINSGRACGRLDCRLWTSQTASASTLRAAGEPVQSPAASVVPAVLPHAARSLLLHTGDRWRSYHSCCKCAGGRTSRPATCRRTAQRWTCWNLAACRRKGASCARTPAGSGQTHAHRSSRHACLRSPWLSG